MLSFVDAYVPFTIERVLHGARTAFSPRTTSCQTNLGPRLVICSPLKFQNTQGCNSSLKFRRESEKEFVNLPVNLYLNIIHPLQKGEGKKACDYLYPPGSTAHAPEALTCQTRDMRFSDMFRTRFFVLNYHEEMHSVLRKYLY